jgi:hypothetical protein
LRPAAAVAAAGGDAVAVAAPDTAAAAAASDLLLLTIKVDALLFEVLPLLCLKLGLYKTQQCIATLVHHTELTHNGNNHTMETLTKGFRN